MKSFLKSLFIGAVATVVVAGCANNDDYGNPLTEAGDCIPAYTANKSVAAVATAAAATGVTPVLYTADDVIEAYVTSSDERGSFFKVLSLQTKPADGSQPLGFSVSVDEPGLFSRGFAPGMKVYIKLKDLYTSKDFGSLKIGAKYEEAGEAPIVGRIGANAYAQHLFASQCEKVSEEALVQDLTIAQAKSDGRLNTLIELQNVQFKEDSFGSTYYDEGASTTFGANPRTIGGATNHLLVDAQGNEIIFRTSSFTNFAGSAIPQGSGTVRGVLTKFLDDYQFVARYESDVQLNQPRLVDEEEPVEPGEGPGPGAVLLFPGSDFENNATFMAGVNTQFGIKSYATVSPGTGLNGTGSLRISTTAATANDYVFNSRAAAGLPSSFSKITFYVKGTSAKSLSINLYKANGTSYQSFNLGDVTANKTINVATSNQYTGVIDTGGNWVLITLDLTGVTDLNTADITKDVFALKVGKDVPYDLYIDNFKIE